MSTQTVTATFKAICNEAIDASGNIVNIAGKGLKDLFDLLVEVEWLTGPKVGRTGWLLCSHYCKWPETLIGEANFLEGCFTPMRYQTDDRLVLGYHPTSVTSYDWEKKGEVVIIQTVREGSYRNQEVSLTYQRGQGDEVYLPTCRSFRRASRIARLFVQDAQDCGRTQGEAFSALEQRFLNQELDLGINSFLFSYMLGALGIEALYPNMQLSTALPEYGEYCEVDGDFVEVIDNGEGFHVAISLPYEVNGEGLEVIDNNPEAGFYHPVFIPYQWEKGVMTVYYDLPKAGFYKPSLIEWRSEQEEGVVVNQNHYSRGYWMAQRWYPGVQEDYTLFEATGGDGTIRLNTAGYMEAEPLPYTCSGGSLWVNQTILEYGWWKAQDINGF